MYVIKSGDIIEDSIKESFDRAWAVYESCQFNDRRFINMWTKIGVDEEEATQLLERIKHLSEYI